MDYQQTYIDIIERLKADQRPILKLTPEFITELKKVWLVALAEKNNDIIKKILCILDNTQSKTNEFNELFFKTFKEIKDQKLIIYALSASQKQVIADSLKTGNIMSSEYFELLKIFLNDKDPEVKEWALRTVESLGPLSLRLKNEVLAAKPGFKKFFNRHEKASGQIIEYLEREWERFKL